MLEDMLRSVRSAYYAMPPRLKVLIGGAYARLPMRVRLGRRYRRFRKLLRQSEGWTRQQLLDYQYVRLKRTLSRAYEQIPYYRRKFDRHGVRPEHLRAPEDMARFPTLTKQEVKENYPDLVARDVPAWKHLVTTTGGSTAEPMRFVQVKGLTRSKEKAFIWDGWARVGYRPRSRCVQLKGRSVARPDRDIYWQYEPIDNFLEMDSNYLTDRNLPLYLEQIHRFGPEFIIGYVSSIYLLARWLRDHPEARVPRVKAVMLASENVYPWQRAMIEEVFGCRVFSHYGHSEMVLLGSECELSTDLHFYPQYGFLEMLDQQGQPVREEGQVGELVGTSFHNPVMPFIRYRTQDYGVVGPPACPECGREYPILKAVEGRLQEFIVTADGRLISICVMGAAHFAELDKVSKTQYYQDTPGRLVFRVVPRPGYTPADRERIRAAVQEKVGAQVRVRVEEVDEIERAPGGKHLMMEQKIPLDVLEGSQELVRADSGS